MTFSFQGRSFRFNRYPVTTNNSLKAWNAGDEYLLQRIESLIIDPKNITIYNDHFGFLATLLSEKKPHSVIQYKSQKYALQENLKANGLELQEELLLSPLDAFSKPIDIVCIKIPKSAGLFELYLQQLLTTLQEDGIVLASFMTRHFSKKIMTIAATYFEEVEQFKAWKKSRLLILKKKKKIIPQKELIKSIQLNEQHSLQQYPGVFSGKQIDLATKYLLELLHLQNNEQKVLDLASGNGVIAYHLRQQNAASEIHLLDDDYLAIESSKLNLTDAKDIFHWADTMDDLADGFFDLIACNPPFHFAYENTIEIALQLFKGAYRCLKDEGRFVVVANQHLNYKTHLQRLFSAVDIMGENNKFVVYACYK